jgi:hypothetical protein
MSQNDLPLTFFAGMSWCWAWALLGTGGANSSCCEVEVDAEN